MKTLLQKSVIIAFFVSFYFTSQKLHAQCGAGFTNSAINFDFQYFHPTSLPASPVNYMFGKSNVMRYAWTNGATTNIFRGSTGAHTGSASSFGAGFDLKFDATTGGADTLVFDYEVTNLQFSVYDIDNRHRIVFTARNAAGVAQNITLAKISGTNLTIAGSGTTSATASTTSTTNIANTSTDGTANVTIAGPVKTVIMTISKTSGSTSDSIYISDIRACNNNTSTGVWSTNYHAVSTPEAGQPAYVLASYNDSLMVLNLTANTASLLYKDNAASAAGINSIAIDPYNQVVYYTDNERISTNKSIFKYNIRTGVRTTWVADVNTLGMQTFTYGMGSGGASFYDGALFLGQDIGLAPTAEPVTVYRIDMDASGNATKASRFWAKQGASASASTYYFDWSDFAINNGIFYNFNSVTTPIGRTSILHFNMNTMDSTVGYTTTARGQVSIDYAGNIYNMTTANRELYNGTGGFGAPIAYTGTGSSVISDAGESFKYPYDYGDSPVGYGIAFNLFKTTPDLMLGAVVDYQVNDSTNATADADDTYDTGSADDEDAVTTFPALISTNTTYTVNVRTTNSSGSAANLYGYIDFNRDGDFADAGERSTVAAVANGTTVATPIAVNWTGLTGGSVGASFIRFRLATSGTEASNYSGYAGTGETEDYPFPITAGSLPVELLEFKATAKENRTTLLNWSTASETNNDYFEVQRKSSDNPSWENLGRVQGKGFSSNLNVYDFTDKTPNDGINYYQLKQVDFGGKTDYSPMVSVTFDVTKADKKATVIVYPNPATNEIWIKTDQEINANNMADIEIFNIVGEKLLTSKMQENTQKINIDEFQKGMYFIKIGTQTYRVLKE